ncbi:type II toxin-antitoxin system RelE/ParE family toxin [Chryseobacterium scophthalmum]
MKKTRVIIVRNYLIFYEFNEKEIIIQSVWDGKRNTK